MKTTAVTDNDARAFIQRLGTFWSAIFTDQQQLLSQFRQLSQQAAQEYINFMEAFECAVYDDIPVYHRELWHTLSLTESELQASPLRYGESGVTYGSGHVYGSSKSTALYMRLADNLRDVQMIHDNPLYPSLTLVRGVDFHIEGEFIYFHKNPFDYSESIVPLFEEDEQVDRGLVLWLQNADYDHGYLISHLGAALKLYLKSNPTSKAILTSLAKLYTSFPSRAYLSLFMAAITDSPCCLGDEETVEQIINYPKKLIITDKRVYAAADEATITVAVGDRLTIGDMMTDAVLFQELAYGLPDSSEFPTVTVGPTLAVGNYKRSLVFPNKQVPVTYENGKIRFEIVGDPDDITLFWNHADSQGGLQYTGTTINPAETLLSCWKGHGIVIKLTARSFGPLAVPDIFTEFVRKVLSPRLVLLSYMEMVLPVDREAFPDQRDEVNIIFYEAVKDADAVDGRDGLIASNINNC